MVLNYIWIAFFLIAFVVALVKLIFFGDMEVFSEILQSTFDMSKTGFELSIGLTGVMTLWLGLMKIGEKGGMIDIMTRMINPFFRRLFPDLPDKHPVKGAIMMNIAANMLGLDNAATPLGLKAMTYLQELNDKKDRASNAMIMFLVLNTSGLTLIPVSVMVYRAQLGAADPSDVFLPILLATFFSTLVGIIVVSIFQKINLFNKYILLYLGGFSAFVAAIIYLFVNMPQEQIGGYSSLAGNIILFGIITVFIVLGVRKKINVYETFIEGAKDGFSIAIKIIPYLVAILVGIGVFRASGAMEWLVHGVEWSITSMGFDAEWVKALPTAIMKPLSGSGARGLMVDTMNTYGADSFAGRLSSMMQGATDTTFYILAVYFGSVGIRKTRYAVGCGLLADLAGIIAAIIIAYIFFG
ncbi:MAG: nucleoside recognition domain-containing protein [Hyphomicrobiales bacterium]